jgi:phosphoribosyl-AMP cyclohydrolase
MHAASPYAAISADIVERLIDAIRFDDRGLVTTVAQDHHTGTVLMVAWMNRDAVRETVITGQVTYWSRSRQSLWRKGETSGHVQRLVGLALDCDGDTLLATVDQTGPACHTGATACFFRTASETGWQELPA